MKQGFYEDTINKIRMHARRFVFDALNWQSR